MVDRQTWQEARRLRRHERIQAVPTLAISPASTFPAHGHGLQLRFMRALEARKNGWSGSVADTRDTFTGARISATGDRAAQCVISARIAAPS